MDLKDNLVQLGYCIGEGFEAQKREVTYSRFYIFKGAELKQGCGTLWQTNTRDWVKQIKDQGIYGINHGISDPTDFKFFTKFMKLWSKEEGHLL